MKRKTLIPSERPCPHNQEVTLGLAVFCASCKIRLRFLSKEAQEAKITKTLEREVKL